MKLTFSSVQLEGDGKKFREALQWGSRALRLGIYASNPAIGLYSSCVRTTVDWTEDKVTYGEGLGYVLGVLLGDGYISKSGQVVFGVKYEDFALAFAEAFESALALQPRHARNSAGQFLVYRQKAGLARFLRKVSQPSWILKREKELWRGVLRGLWDSEGCIARASKKCREVSFHNTDRDIINLYMRLLFDVCGIETHVRVRKKKGCALLYGVYFGRHEDVVKFYRLVGTAIRRKAKRFQEVM